MATLIGDGGHARDIAATGFYSRKFAHHKEWTPDNSWLVIGINDPHIRAFVAEEIDYMDVRWTHPNAYVGIGCEIGMGSHINYGVTMTRTKVGIHTTIGPGVTIGGDVTIGDRVNVCMGALIGVRHPGEHIYIGHDATIGAGAVVLHDIPAGETWVGNPARRIK